MHIFGINAISFTNLFDLCYNVFIIALDYRTVHRKVIVIILLLFAFGTNLADADQIFVTLTSGADDIIFDGKWTFYTEWKESSENMINFNDGSRLSIKTAHDYENLYFLIDFISDTSLQKFADRGIVCIDSKLNRGDMPNEDDYCFSVVVGSQHPITLRGGNILAQTGFLEKINNHPQLIAAGGISDKNDRYTKNPHTSYEFKIPLETFGKSSIYGFYVVVYDANSGKAYSWPKDAAIETSPFIPEPKHWGELVSPDKSIPEFDTPLFLLLSITVVVFLGRTRIIRQQHG